MAIFIYYQIQTSLFKKYNYTRAKNAKHKFTLRICALIDFSCFVGHAEPASHFVLK